MRTAEEGPGFGVLKGRAPDLPSNQADLLVRRVGADSSLHTWLVAVDHVVRFVHALNARVSLQA
jgi:hypothetical protein